MNKPLSQITFEFAAEQRSPFDDDHASEVSGNSSKDITFGEMPLKEQEMDEEVEMDNRDENIRYDDENIRHENIRHENVQEMDAKVDVSGEVEVISHKKEQETDIKVELDNKEKHIRNEPVKRTVSTRGRKSLKDLGQQIALVQVPADEILFQKHYYSIGEVAIMFRENQSLIRYWETEFDILQPKKNKKGDRYFRPIDVKNLELIYDLLRRRKFTIEGAKEFLKKNKRAEEKFAMIQSLEKMKNFFLQLKASL